MGATPPEGLSLQSPAGVRPATCPLSHGFPGLEEMKECFLIEFADGTKARGVAETLEGRAAIPKDTDRREGWTNGSLMRSSKDRSKGLSWSGLGPCSGIGEGLLAGLQLGVQCSGGPWVTLGQRRAIGKEGQEPPGLCEQEHSQGK